MNNFTESTVEEAVLDWLSELGYSIKFGPDIAVDGISPERSNYQQTVLSDRLRNALQKLNPKISPSSLEDAFRKLTTQQSRGLYASNHEFHRMLTDGIAIEIVMKDGSLRHEQVWPIEFEHLEINDWLAVNQLTVIENQRERRPDIVIYLNGLPIAVIELKNPRDTSATIERAFNQLQTYKKKIPTLFITNELLIVSDGTDAKIGSLTAEWGRFMPWRTVEGIKEAPKGLPDLKTLLNGVFQKKRLLDLIRNFIVFSVDGSEVVKKVSGYHQFHAVTVAVKRTTEASSVKGDRKIGVVWHTQGSGKSLTMAFYAGKIIQLKEMANPTLLVLTDRNDLDNQLYDEFSRSHELLRQKPEQAESRKHLRELLRVASGGVVFTTIQKFLPESEMESKDSKRAITPLLSERRNIVVIADEAHRSEYGFVKGLARHMRDALPNASFIAFTGTPLELADRSTVQIFGDYIDIYDIQRAIEDKFTVPIYYEARMAKLSLKDSERPNIDREFEEITEEEETRIKERLKTKWGRLEAIVGSERRVNVIAKDIVKHFEARTEALEGKAMIVCMSRRICVDMYNAIIKQRPEWNSKDDDKGEIKVVMTGSASDPERFQPHIRNKVRRDAIQKRFKNENDHLKIVIVRDMWLTGFDAPILNTMYIDKPMRGHGLMQTIARVNRVFKDKPGGLIVDFIGIGGDLRKALANYTKEDREDVGIDQEVAVSLLLEKYEVCKGLFHRFDYSKFFSGKATDQLEVMSGAM
ncbi:MAG: type I restriction endonuclease subunit R, partial [Rhabdochlamydiaceae bacterium]